MKQFSAKILDLILIISRRYKKIEISVFYRPKNDYGLSPKTQEGICNPQIHSISAQGQWNISLQGGSALLEPTTITIEWFWFTQILILHIHGKINQDVKNTASLSKKIIIESRNFSPCHLKPHNVAIALPRKEKRECSKEILWPNLKRKVKKDNCRSYVTH